MPSPDPQSFLASPEPHHHVSRLVVLAVILAIIVLVIWLWAYVFTPNAPITANVPTPSPVISAEQMKSEIVQQLSSAPDVSKLTVAQKAAITTQLGKNLLKK